MNAVDHANRICSWQENLTSDEQPPSWMWHLDEELEIWFKSVDEKRKSAYSATGGSEDEAPDLAENVLAKGRRG